ncbi:ATP-binding protein [Burkholderia sp. Ac-20392]|uniref:AAA family ATPase n=1 Tax=Burkholderia sp. Ac-20392 TaxID=2703905 RepID=UPI001982656E|nr:ATP-binding protein [Burkholderia sp. Ac-20392]MBN3794577.1 AAA family ATPase [Burkholderia sp. Ac-20392]
MIVSLRVRNFKSIVDTKLRFSETFNCFVGMNGAGKTSILQAIDFASHLMRGDVEQWLKQRGWKSQDLHSRLSTAVNIVTFITFKLPSGKLVKWRSAFNRQTGSCTREDVYVVNDLERDDLDIFDPHPDNILFDVRRGKYSIGKSDKIDISFNYEGSLLSLLKKELLTEDIVALRDGIRNIRSLELLSPHLMRSVSRESDVDIGIGGEKLSAFLYKIKGDQRAALIHLLKSFYPSIVDYKVVQQRAGWKRLSIIEEHGGKRIESEAKYTNDGLLRILAILAQTAMTESTLLFDEIENGVNPEIVEKLVDALQRCSGQIIVTTHSPVVLNYLEDNVAMNAIQFIYRSGDGSTKARPFFQLPRATEKLQIMGPGEAFIDTSLPALVNEAIELDQVEKNKLEEFKRSISKKIMRNPPTQEEK